MVVVGVEEREGEGDEKDEGGHMSTGDGEGGSDKGKECPLEQTGIISWHKWDEYGMSMA